jgi:hypothetical protein
VVAVDSVLINNLGLVCHATVEDSRPRLSRFHVHEQLDEVWVQHAELLWVLQCMRLRGSEGEAFRNPINSSCEAHMESPRWAV